MCAIVSINAPADILSGSSNLHFSLSLYVNIYFVYASRECSGESALCASSIGAQSFHHAMPTKIACADSRMFVCFLFVLGLGMLFDTTTERHDVNCVA